MDDKEDTRSNGDTRSIYKNKDVQTYKTSEVKLDSLKKNGSLMNVERLKPIKANTIFSIYTKR